MASRVERIASHVAAAEAAAKGVEMAPTGALGVAQPSVFGKVGVKAPSDVVIVSAVRTAICKAKKGAFANTTPDDLLKTVLEAVMKKSGCPHDVVGDVICGNVQTVGAYSLSGRAAQLRAGFPAEVPFRSVNRQCSSGLQAIASIAAEIQAGYIDAGIGCGVESMTLGGNPSDPSSLPPMNMGAIFEHPLAKDCLTPMGITSENVAAKFGIPREKQDALAVASHEKALLAQKNGWFKEEIVPITVTVQDKDGNEKEVTVTADEGPKAGTTMEVLGKLKPAFQKGGSTTAGNASQVSDGAAAVLLMRRSLAEKLKLPIMGTFRGFKVAGVDPAVMGIGPEPAIRNLLKDVNLSVKDIDWFELNEAFASQATYCVEKLGIPAEKLNPVGGAIALGHPLGCTGARQVATLFHGMKRTGKKLGVVSMCIGTGMGAAFLGECE